MKHFFTTCKAACLAAVAALTAACGSEADYRTALPADAFVTMSFNPAQLAAKSGMGDMSQHPLCLRIEKELNGMEGLSAEEKAYCLALLKNPEETGIDGSRDAYLFLSPENLSAANPVVRGGMLLPIGDLTKFETLIDRINTRSGSETVREGELSVVRIGEQEGVSGLCAYDGAACMLYFAQDAYEETLSRVKGLFAQKREESLVGNAAVERLFSEKNDINVAVSYGVLVQENPMLASLPMAGALEGVKALGSVNFEKGRRFEGGRGGAGVVLHLCEAPERLAAEVCARIDRCGAGLRTERFGTLCHAFADARLRNAARQSDGQAGDGRFRRRPAAALLGNASRRQLSGGVALGRGR